MDIITIELQGDQQVLRLPAGMAFEGITQLEISKAGDIMFLRPARLHWIRNGTHHDIIENGNDKKGECIEEK